MDLEIKDPETLRIIAELAAATGLSEVEAVKKAAADKLSVLRSSVGLEEKENAARRPFTEVVRELQARLRRYPNTGLGADKAFYDSLYE
jgi:antitoxin VapB